MGKLDILSVMKPGKEYTVDEVYSELKISGTRPTDRATVSSYLSKLSLKGHIVRVDRGRYVLP